MHHLGGHHARWVFARTHDVPIRKSEAFYLNHPAVENVTLLGGLDIVSGCINTTSAATMFVTLSPSTIARTPR